MSMPFDKDPKLKLAKHQIGV